MQIDWNLGTLCRSYKLDKVWNLIQVLYHIQVHTCLALNFILQVFYSKFKLELEQDEFTSTERSEEREQTVRNFEYVTNLINWLSPLTPEFMITNLMLLVTYMAVSIPRITANLFDLNRNFHVKYLRKSISARRIEVELQLNVIIHQLLESNANFVNNLIKPRLRNDTCRSIRRTINEYDKYFNNVSGFDSPISNEENSSSTTRTKFVVDFEETHNRHQCKSSPCFVSPRRRLSCDFYNNQSMIGVADKNCLTMTANISNLESDDLINQQIRIVRCEFNYLRSLLQDKRTIWPDHRNPEWLRIIRILWFLMRFSVFFGLVFTSNTLLYTIFEMDHTFKLENGLKTPKPSWIRRIIFFEMFFSMIWISDFASDPIIDSLIDRLDNVKLATIFDKKVQYFKSKASELRHKLELTTTMAHSRKFRMKKTFLDIVRLEIDRFECNKLSLDTYITFRYLIIQYNSSKSNMEAFVNQVSSEALIIFILMITGIDNVNKISPSEYKMIIGYVLIIFSYVNGTLLSVSVLNIFFMNVIKGIWSILHVSMVNLGEQPMIMSCPSSRCKIPYQLHNQLEGQKHYCEQRRRKSNYIPGAINQRQKPTAINHDRQQESSYNGFADILRYSVISPHLTLLWSRTIQYEQSLLTDLFRCELFGLIPIDYTSMIRLNFWALSFVMVSKIYLIFYTDVA